MPTAPPHEIDGQPYQALYHRSLTEALAGNGVRSGLSVSPTATDMEIKVDAGTAVYIATTHELESPVPKTIAAADGSDDRYDTVYLDTSTAAPTVGVRKGTAEAYPTPPGIQGDEILLAVVVVEAGATDIGTDAIINLQSRVAEAGLLPYGDSTGVYTVNNVAAALDQLQEAAQIGAYPLANSDLANNTVTVTAGTGLATTNAPIGLGGSATLSVDEVTSSQITDGTIQDGDISGSTIISRSKVDDERVVAATQTGVYTTSGEEVIPVDSSNGPLTITLATADLSEGNFVTVSDVAGTASTNAVTIDTEGGATIDGGSTTALDTDWGASVLYSPDGTQWVTAGGGSGSGGSLTLQDDGATVADPADTLDTKAGLAATSPTGGEVELTVEHTEIFEGRESGSVSDTNQGVLVIDTLADGEAVEIYKSVLTNADGTATPSDVDLELVTLDNSGGFTSRATLISSDGNTVYDSETGSPLGSYTNSSGAGETIAVLVNNQSGGAVTIMAAAEGVTGE